MTPKCAAPRIECHGRTNSTDRTNAGTKRRGCDVAGASRFPSAEGAGAIAPIEAAGGTDRETKTRAGRAEPAPGRIGTGPRRNDGQAVALARDPGARRIRLAKEARAD